jgi:hypothetical protein
MQQRVRDACERMVVGMRRSTSLVTVTLAVSLIIVAGTPAQAESVENFHLLTSLASLGTDTCSFEVAPAPESQCLATVVFLVRESQPNDQVRKLSLVVGVLEARYVFHSVDEPVTVLHERSGVVEAPSAFIDARLTAAAVTASVPMDDGSTYVMDLAWDMSGAPFQVAGTDGPINEPGIPWGTRLVDDCTTGNWHAHEAWRLDDE